jgi:hypothetical protein
METEKKQRAKDFFKKRVTGEEASDMFTDDEEFKQDMMANFLENGCNTNQQLDFLISLDPSKGDLTGILNVNQEILGHLKELNSSYPKTVNSIGRSTAELESYIDNITMVNKALNDLIHG